MGRHLKKLCLVAVFCSAFSQLLAQGLLEGTYETSGPSHYLDGKVILKSWANGSMDMFATLVKGEHQYDVKAWLEPVGLDEYQGSGIITVRYPSGGGCQHRFGIRLFVEDPETFYIRENTPRYIPYNENGPCTAAGPYIWFNHPAPYRLQ